MFRNRVELLLAVGPVQDEDLYIRRKLLRFGGPVGHQAGRRDDQHWVAKATTLLLQRDQSQDLDGFAQSHVIGQDAA